MSFDDAMEFALRGVSVAKPVPVDTTN